MSKYTITMDLEEFEQLRSKAKLFDEGFKFPTEEEIRKAAYEIPVTIDYGKNKLFYDGVNYVINYINQNSKK